MKKKISYFLFILFLILGVFFIYRSCTKIPIKELETLHNKLKASDRNIKSIQFYSQRPDFHARIIYSGEIKDSELKNIVSHLKNAVTYELFVQIANTYRHGSFPSRFKIFVYKDFYFNSVDPSYKISVPIVKSTFFGSEEEKNSNWYIEKIKINPDTYNKKKRVYDSYINGFRILIGGTILIPLLCILFVQYRKWKRY